MTAPLLHSRPFASAVYWPEIARLFRAGYDTQQIARKLILPEAAVANSLADALRSAAR